MTKKSFISAALVLAVALVASGTFDGLGQSVYCKVEQLSPQNFNIVIKTEGQQNLQRLKSVPNALSCAWDAASKIVRMYPSLDLLNRVLGIRTGGIGVIREALAAKIFHLIVSNVGHYRTRMYIYANSPPFPVRWYVVGS